MSQAVSTYETHQRPRNSAFQHARSIAAPIPQTSIVSRPSIREMVQDSVAIGKDTVASLLGEIGRFGFQSEVDLFGAPGTFPDTSPVSGVSSTGLLGVGNAGPEVRELQEQLNARDQNIKVDGIFGPETEAAVRAFQETQKIDGKPIAVDGIVGPETRAALEQSKPAAAEAETPGSEAPDQDNAKPGESPGDTQKTISRNGQEVRVAEIADISQTARVEKNAVTATRQETTETARVADNAVTAKVQTGTNRQGSTPGAQAESPSDTGADNDDSKSDSDSAD